MTDFPSKLRHSRISDRWVLIAAGRGKRLHQFDAPSAAAKRDPFEPANIPPGDIVGSVARRADDFFKTEADWSVVAIRNAFPYVAPGDQPRLVGPVRDGYGYAELVIHSPDADRNFEDFDTAQTAAILGLYQERYRALAKDSHLKYIQVFTNRGPEAGASVIHPHSQIVALPIVPPHVARLVEAARRHHQRHGSSVVEDELVEETKAGERIISETAHFIAYCPFAPQANYHVRIFPKHHAEHFDRASRSSLEDLAELINRLYAALKELHGDAPYNAFIRTAPLQEKDLPGFRWHLDILPHLSTPGGLEASTDLLVLTAAPEKAAAEIKDAL